MHVGKMFALSVHRRKKSETADDRAQNLHRPRRLREVLHRIDERLGKRAAGAQLAFQLFELVAVGKLAVEQKVDDLFERRIGREIVDVVAAIAPSTLLSSVDPTTTPSRPRSTTVGKESSKEW